MPIRFNCGFCNQLLSIGGSREGTQVHCPLCGGVLTVPRLPPGTFDYSTDDVQVIEEDPAQPGSPTRLRRAPSTDLPAGSTDPGFELPLEDEQFAPPGVRKALAVLAVGLVVALLGAGGLVIYLVVANSTNRPAPPVPGPPAGQVAALPAPKPEPEPQPPGKPPGVVNPPPGPVEPKVQPAPPAKVEPQPPPVPKLPRQGEPEPVPPVKKPPADEPPPVPVRPKPEEKSPPPPVKPKTEERPPTPREPPPAPKVDPKAPRKEERPPAPEVAKKPPEPAKVEPTPEEARLAFDSEVKRLSGVLREAAPESQDGILEKFRSARGEVIDRALARAIPDLSDEVRQKAREILRERIGAEPLKMIRANLSQEDRELRYAAVRVCRQKKVRALVPDLIPRLNDPDGTIIWHARKTLEEMTGYDIGPRIGASPRERAEAVQFWQRWWKKHGTK